MKGKETPRMEWSSLDLPLLISITTSWVPLVADISAITKKKSVYVREREERE